MNAYTNSHECTRTHGLPGDTTAVGSSRFMAATLPIAKPYPLCMSGMPAHKTRVSTYLFYEYVYVYMFVLKQYLHTKHGDDA